MSTTIQHGAEAALGLSSRHAQPHPSETTLANIRRLMSEDRKVLSKHPILKHLFDRYTAVVLDVHGNGHPTTPVEPIREFNERVNDLIVERHNKTLIKKRKYQSRINKKAAERSVKRK